MDERDYLNLFQGLPGSFHGRYVMPPPHFVPPPPVPAATPIIPNTGAAKYWYVDPRAKVNPVLPTATDERTGVLPKNVPFEVRNSPFKGVMFAQNDRGALLNDINNSFYGGGQAPIPTPTPPPARHWYNPATWFNDTPTPKPIQKIPDDVLT